MHIRYGGSFAPPLTDEALALYEELAAAAPLPIRDSLVTLLRCVRRWWELPVSLNPGKTHPSGRGIVVPLSPELQQTLYDLIPWSHELAGMQRLFDEIPTSDRELRNAAFHLLWHVKELDLDREPMTDDLL